MRRPANSGVVLVAVLFAVAIMSVMVVAITSLTRSGIASQRLDERLLATHLALRSGVERAKALVLSAPPEERIYFDGTPATVDLGNGIEAEITIRDAAGLVDLNRSDVKLVTAILEGSLSPAAARDIAGRITEWREKAASQPKPPATAAPAQTPKPAGQAPATPGEESKAAPAAVIFAAVEQLLAMVEEDGGDATSDASADAAALDARFTVFNPTGLVNPLAAPDDLLLAVPDFTDRDLALVRGVRKTRSWKTDIGLKLLVERLNSSLSVRKPWVFIIGVKLIRGPGIIPQSQTGVVVMENEKGPLPFQTLSVSGL